MLRIAKPPVVGPKPQQDLCPVRPNACKTEDWKSCNHKCAHRQASTLSYSSDFRKIRAFIVFICRIGSKGTHKDSGDSAALPKAVLNNNDRQGLRSMRFRTAGRWLYHVITSSEKRPYIQSDLYELEAFIEKATQDRDTLKLLEILHELRHRIFNPGKRDQLVKQIAAVLGEYEGILLSPSANHAAIAAARRKYEVDLELRSHEQQRLDRDERERQRKELVAKRLRRDKDKKEAERKAKEAAAEQARLKAEAKARREEEERTEAERKNKDRETAAVVILEYKEKAKRSEKIEEAKRERTDIHESDHLWIEKLDRHVRLDHEERLGIRSEISKSDRSIDDWIDELLHQQEDFFCDENAGHHSSDSDWLEDIRLERSKPKRDGAERSNSRRHQEKAFNINSNKHKTLKGTRQTENSNALAISNESAASEQGASTEWGGNNEFFPFAYQAKADILRITNCHPSALKKAAKELRCKAPFSLVDADRLALVLTGDASIRRVYVRRLEDLGSHD